MPDVDETKTPGTEPSAEAPHRPTKAEREAAAELARHHSWEELLELAQTAERGAWIEDDPEQIYRVGIWGREGEGVPNYTCRECGWAIINPRGPALVFEHYRARHQPDEDERGSSGLVNSRGELL